MEFQEAVTKMGRPSHRDVPGSPRSRWNFFNRSSKSKSSSSAVSVSSTSSSPRVSVSSKPQPKPSDFPAEFICPVSGSVMADPVIVSSGHSFDRVSVEACKSAGYIPVLGDGAAADFSAVITNMALKSAILSHCKRLSLPPPEPNSSSSVEKIVLELMAVKKEARDSSNSVVASLDRIVLQVTETEVSGDSATQSYSSSDESAGTTTTTSSTATAEGPTSPRQFVTRRRSCSSSEIDAANPGEHDDLIAKLKSSQIFEVEEAAIALRKITRSREDSRISLCTDRLLLALRSLIVSRYGSVQANSVAALVNLSLEKVNKAKIMRSGITPDLIAVLKAGSPEAREHAAGAVFSLAVDDHNKMGIGALGALPPLVDMLRSTSEQGRNDSALALYHLSLVQSNCIKLIRIGSVPVFLGLLRSGHLVDRVLLILCNLGAHPDSRTALFDSGATDYLLGLLDQGVLKSNSARDNCLNALLALSRVGLRFKGIAKAAGAMEILKKVEFEGPGKKARLLMDIIREKTAEEEEEEVDWEELLGSGPPSPKLDGPAV